ncbi:cytochrome P450 [Rhodococcus sp. WAY2]|uniref:cytochrome P450 n=1 Tax=Rhodococcus sp. WAY2 TaxID=2663121 RepID=UPI00135A8A1F|nr:cytochrome P450 [Rhodococcus sp. WAY2]
MTNVLQLPLPRGRGRLSSVLLAPLPSRVDTALRGASDQWPVQELAPTPAGSGLKPVHGTAGLPLLGHTLDYLRFGSDFTRARYQRFGPVSWMGAFGTKMVVVAGPDATQKALTTKAKSFSQDGWTYLIDAFFHRGLMLMSFDEHQMHRRIMQEAFTRDRLAGYVNQLGPTLESSIPGWPTGKSTRIYPLLKSLTLDIATEVFMAGRGGSEDTDAINDAFVATVRAASSIVRIPLPGTRWRAGVRGRALLEAYFARHLPAARSAQGNDLFAGLCHARTAEGEAFTDEDVVNHMIFLMMAAHDTSTITTAAAYFLAKHPMWQERARAESDQLGEQAPDIDDLESLATLDLVIKETLRLVAPVPIVMRKTVEAVEIAGHHIPADTLVAVAPAGNHFDESCWTDPDTFDPDRFSESRREDQQHRFGWIPFGGGVHKCIGLHFGTLEVKAILHQMLRNYTWTVPDHYEARWDNTSLPIPVDGLPITLERR